MQPFASLFVLFLALSGVFGQNNLLQIQYALQFKGSFAINNNQFTAVAKAKTTTLTTLVSPTFGVRMDKTELHGTKADLYISGTINGQTVQLTGNVTFGTHLHAYHVLFLSGGGGLAPTPLTNVQNLIGAWGVTGGLGAFQGATGSSSINALVDFSDQTFVDSEFGLFWVSNSTSTPSVTVN
eukprot:TRINITY_DN9516_c0_g1_i1.p1 TRINITY_DN9516_c0_g1~~TRINITY_DN9516_c0_g1_i1.p1  ORF type:complete len:182 (+),score=55.95 TRINITY_DN9516_c0_g1_i1:75-620(+)